MSKNSITTRKNSFCLLSIALTLSGLSVTSYRADGGEELETLDSEVQYYTPDVVDDPQFQPIHTPKSTLPDKIKLGERLFNDPRLSKNNTISCATCHQLTNGGDDGKPRSIGVDGQEGHINAPTVFNAVGNLAQFWDGRADTLESQIDGPIQNSVEMGSTWEEVEKKVLADSNYASELQRLYGVVSRHSIKRAIADFERSLVTPNSRFDLYLRGNKTALNEDEQRGLALFKSLGCVSCHQGVNVGGNMFQVFGVMGNYFKDRGNIQESDYGLYNTTKNEEDRFVFKVPSLRNVENTAPYFHDGSAPTLEAAINVMGRYQLGRQLAVEEISLLAAFLRTLTGEYGGEMK